LRRLIFYTISFWIGALNPLFVFSFTSFYVEPCLISRKSTGTTFLKSATSLLYGVLSLLIALITVEIHNIWLIKMLVHINNILRCLRNISTTDHGSVAVVHISSTWIKWLILGISKWFNYCFVNDNRLTLIHVLGIVILDDDLVFNLRTLIVAV